MLQVVVDFNCKRFDSYLQILRAGFGVRVRHGREVEVGFIGYHLESRLLAFLSDKEQKDKNDSNIAQLKKKRRKKKPSLRF